MRRNVASPLKVEFTDHDSIVRVGLLENCIHTNGCVIVEITTVVENAIFSERQRITLVLPSPNSQRQHFTKPSYS